MLFDKNPHGKVKYNDKVLSFESLLNHPPIKPDFLIDPVKDLSYILYTGDTTGFPKGVPGNHSSMTSYVNDVTFHVAGDHLLEGKDVYIGINPFFYIMVLVLFMAIWPEQGKYVCSYAFSPD